MQVHSPGASPGCGYRVIVCTGFFAADGLVGQEAHLSRTMVRRPLIRTF